MELFKYCELQHMQSMQERGTVRVGSLNDYQDKEQYGEMVADADEGKKTMSGSVKMLTPETLKNYPGLDGVIDFQYGKIENLTILGRKVHSDNCLVFSASAVYSEKAHQEWLQQENYHACYRIYSSKLFFRAITRMLRSRGYEFFGCAQVLYADEVDIASQAASISPAFCKKKKFAPQAEVRAIWRSVNADLITPQILDMTEAFRYVTAHRVLISN